MGRFPEVQNFIRNKAKQFDKLKVEYVRGAQPTLKMRLTDGSDETIQVAQWSTDTLVEFMNTKLAKA